MSMAAVLRLRFGACLTISLMACVLFFVLNVRPEPTGVSPSRSWDMSPKIDLLTATAALAAAIRSLPSRLSGFEVGRVGALLDAVFFCTPAAPGPFFWDARLAVWVII
jgi:hypothetical protein